MARSLPDKAEIMVLPEAAPDRWVLITYGKDSEQYYSWEILRRSEAEGRIEELNTFPWLLWLGFVEITDSQRETFLHHEKIYQRREARSGAEREAERRLARHQRVTDLLRQNVSGRNRREVSESRIREGAR